MSIRHYQEFLGDETFKYLLSQAQDFNGVEGLKQIGQSGGLETVESMKFLVELYQEIKIQLDDVLEQRKADREFLDERVKACYEYNNKHNIEFESARYKTVLGLEDSKGRIVIGPKKSNYCQVDGSEKQVAPIPQYLQGNHVTLFGPPESAKMSVNAMNAYHRQLKGEPEIVRELLSTHESLPKWGADDEDSKTPMREDLISAGVNLTDCFNKKIYFKDEKKNKEYKLAEDKLSMPIKRFPGLALPCSYLFYEDSPIPLHLYDFALHLFENWHNQEALCFYVPKLENEEEAKYIHDMFEAAEKMIKKLHPEYQMGTLRVLIVLENPRAVFRANELMDELYPYFAGASLGWHDYLGSAARLFKEDGNYRIPVKADPDIVIKHIKASHELLAEVVGPRGGIKIGGMYGILPVDGDINSDSFQLTLKGYFRDVFTQMKRNLSGFWVAHPDFVRIGLAMIEAWKFYEKGDKEKLFKLVKGLLHEKYHDEVINFIEGDDIESLDKSDELYPRALLAANLGQSDFIANNDPDEIRYNVFQSLQYITDWLSGNGCVALPSQINDIPVRVMDDLATAERSRWEVWHELYHGRFSKEEFIKIVHEEMNFIRRDLSNDKKIVQVKYNEQSAKWYPVAKNLMLKLMTDEKPVEFATQLLLPFVISDIRDCDDPWAKVLEIDERKFEIEEKTKKLDYYFEQCGENQFAATLAKNAMVDLDQAKDIVLNFTKEQVIQAASFHGDIGQSKKSLDSNAQKEQALVDGNQEELLKLGFEYKEKFGIKFLISAKGKSADDLMSALKQRMNNSFEQELENARQALWEITFKRIEAHPLDNLKKKLQNKLEELGIHSAQLSISSGFNQIQSINLGQAKTDQYFEMASLSKTIGSAFALEYLKEKGISIEESYNSHHKLKIENADDIKIKHLMSHLGLNMHYVKGIACNESMPHVDELIKGNEKFGYPKVEKISAAGQKFQYSGAGFLCLESLIDHLSGGRVHELASEFVKDYKIQINPANLNQNYADGYLDDGSKVESGRLMFPAFAAGHTSTATAMTEFMQTLAMAYQNIEGHGKISHDSAVQMLHGKDLGSMRFMGAKIGLGTFVAECGPNKIALHQGANDGFRSVYLYVFDGPDLGKGLTVFSNGDNKAMLFNAAIMQEVLKQLNIQGVNSSKFKQEFNFKNIEQEQIVNLGYKELVFCAFEPSLPKKIIRNTDKEKDHLRNKAIDAKILEVSNQKFARAQNLFSPYCPHFDPDEFHYQGKVMDSWESARHNPVEFDFVHFQTKKSFSPKTLSVCTKFHLGNQAKEIELLGLKNDEAIILVPRSEIKGHAKAYFKIETSEEFDQFILRNYPDGGISRIGLYEDELSGNFVYEQEIPQPNKPMSLRFWPNREELEDNLNLVKDGELFENSSRFFGAKMAFASNEHYGPALQTISPYPPLHMFDGFESARSREAGNKEELIIDLALERSIEFIDFDFTYFRNNNPNFISLEGRCGARWIQLSEHILVKPFAGSVKRISIQNTDIFNQIKVNVFPDGGINRVRVYSKK